ncbi:MAG: PKD domain-containing protein [Flavobacteriales bacterium]|nr:PKD domain-containing protein [Flavobacteriales bacterium]
MLKILLVPALLTALATTIVNGQDGVHPCGANELHRLGALAPEDLQQIQAADAELEAFTVAWAEANSGAERVNYVIPVVFHIIHNYGPENISDEQVYDAIRVLNDDYNKLNLDWPNVRPEFLDLVANVGIEFRLATKDPNGNCTKGITRTVSTLTNDGTQTMKNLIQWPRNKYLNIWVAASADGAAGYTFRPGSVTNNAGADGIVVQHSYTGAIGTSSPSRSRTLTHEVGHWINLQHTWGGTNDPAVAANCNDDDGVSDTPNTIGWTNCTLSGTSCGSLDNVENYMEYSYCSKMFTLGQKTRMLASLNASTSQRNQLTTPANLSATGVSAAPVLCAAEFDANSTLICAGSSVTYTDLSFHGVTSRNWNFPGGTPATSTDATPTITYTEPGTYTVSLTVSDGSSTLTSTQNTSIIVMANPGEAVPVVEGFESVAALNGPEWYVNNPTGGNTFALTSTASFSGSKSVRVLNTAAMDGTSDELLSRTFDMSNAEDIVISFRYAYAKRTSTSDDVLSLYVSNDCGNLWSLRKIMRGSNVLTTGGVVTSSFIPTSASQWGYTEVTNISSTSHVSNFRFKFVFDSNGGNNLYLDDININGMPVGVEDLSNFSDRPLLLVPNPATDRVQVRYALSTSSRVRLDVLDALGRQVRLNDLGTVPAGERSFVLDLGALARGSYTVRLIGVNGTLTSRLVVE